MKQTFRLAVVIMFAMFYWNTAYAESPRTQLKQMVEQLQQNPNDDALREKIIALALKLNPKPTTPDAAIMAEGAAEYAFKNAKSVADYSDAAKQYEKALLFAPWLANDYFNCGVAHEKAGDNQQAIHSLNFYLLAEPHASDAQVIKKRIGGLQYALQKAVDVSSNTVKPDVVQTPPIVQLFDCHAPKEPRAFGVTFSFDFSSHIVTSRLKYEDGRDAGPSNDPPLSFQEVGSHLIWTTPPPDSSVANGFQNNLNRDTGSIDTIGPFGQLYASNYQCTMSNQ
jgi:hypothetical protein